MEKLLQEISNHSTLFDNKYCSVCGVLILGFSCKCSGIPQIMKLTIPIEMEEYFWMDGSVKANLISYENSKC